MDASHEPCPANGSQFLSPDQRIAAVGYAMVAGWLAPIFNPIVAGRSYTLMTSPDLKPGSCDPLSGGSASDDCHQRMVTDPAASETKKFYKVEIVKP